MAHWKDNLIYLRSPRKLIVCYDNVSFYISSYTVIEPWPKEDTMQVIFSIEIKTDINSADKERRAAFVEMMRKTAKRLHAQASMLSDSSPATVVMKAESAGMEEDIPVFDNIRA